MRKRRQSFRGIVVPVVTPLTSSEKIDEKSLVKILQHLLKAKVNGVFVNSTTGEGVCLTDDEKKQVLQITIEVVGGKIPVYAGISETSLKRVREQLKWVENSGADVVVVHPSYYFPPSSQQELYEFFNLIAQETFLPLMLYNIPFTTKAPLSVDTVSRLAQVENIVGIKDSSADFVFLLDLIEIKKQRPDFMVFIGKSHMWTAGILSGADGGLDGISNLIPEHCVRLYEHIIQKKPDVYELQNQINEIWRVYECHSFLGGIKYAMSLLDLCEPWTSKPIPVADVDEQAKIRHILENNGIIKGKKKNYDEKNKITSRSPS